MRRKRATLRTAAVLNPKLFASILFDEHEQRQLFDAELPSENFDAFRSEVARFDLAALLGNPGGNPHI